MASSKTFSLRSLFLWCSIAAVLLAIVGLGYRGVDWASGASWALLGAMITMATLGVLYWVAHSLALLFDRIGPRRERGGKGVATHDRVPAANNAPQSHRVLAGSQPDTQP